MITGKIGYMKTMWKWLTQREWEVTEEEMQFSMEQDINNETAYGANII